MQHIIMYVFTYIIYLCHEVYVAANMRINRLVGIIIYRKRYLFFIALRTWNVPRKLIRKM